MITNIKLIDWLLIWSSGSTEHRTLSDCPVRIGNAGLPGTKSSQIDWVTVDDSVNENYNILKQYRYIARA